jgi:hypothetical protein
VVGSADGTCVVASLSTSRGVSRRLVTMSSELLAGAGADFLVLIVLGADACSSVPGSGKGRIACEGPGGELSMFSSALDGGAEGARVLRSWGGEVLIGRHGIYG